MGWIKDPPDYRDRPYAATSLRVGGPLPDVLPVSADLRPAMPRVRDQGQLGSCTANAANAVVEYIEKITSDPDRDALSRLWTYWFSRDKIGLTQEDSGAHLRHAFQVLAERGAPREVFWPYIEARFRDNPAGMEKAAMSAPHHRVLEYLSIPDTDEDAMRACIAEGFPFAFGFTVYQSFWQIGDDGMWSGERGPIDGYHAVTAVGYTATHWIIRNSWSTGWGDQGHFYVPRGFMQNEAYDLWTARRVALDP